MDIKIFKKELNENDSFVKAVFSETDGTNKYKKINVKPLIIKNKVLFQFEAFENNKAYHFNFELNYKECEKFFNDYCTNFKQYYFRFSNCSVTYNIKNNKTKRKVLNEKQVEINLNHNNEKKYILKENQNIPALVDLGIFTKEFKVNKAMFDKYKQINKFIEIIDDSFKNNKKENLTILDFGCGKSYLTFIIYYYFKFLKNINVKILGFDLKQDVVLNCNNIAKKYGYDNLKFYNQDVSKIDLKEKIDMIVTLHACDTATDYALNFAIKNNIENIFSVPCCQHEINKSIVNGGEFNLLMKHGLIKERFCALLTDAIRVKILEEFNYKCDVIKFVDFENTPKNIMIRATKKPGTIKVNLTEVEKLLNNYKFNQTLYNLIKKH